MNKIALIIHGGASDASSFLENHFREYEIALRKTVERAFKILQRGGSALNAVEQAVIDLENNYLFNAGRGSALNNKGEVEMDAAIMEGKTLKAGAVAMVRQVKNPISLARVVMTKTKHVLVSSYGALELATSREVDLEPESYFITEHQYEIFLHTTKKRTQRELNKQKNHGTVGAVALDKKGNLASATSTGGTDHCLPGRIGDSCIIGAGCYADNRSCAVSGTGEGEHLIRGVIAHTIAMLMELKGYSLQKACDETIRLRNPHADIGVIAVDPHGNLGISFNTEIMKRAWRTSEQSEVCVRIYPDKP